MTELKILEVNGKKLSARVTGVGPPIILFHSLLADGTSFDPISAELRKTHQTIILNLPGFAESAFVGGDLNTIADHIAKWIEALDLSQKPIFLGNGYGGFIALIISIRHPDIAARLVLSDCGAVFSEPGRAAFRMMSATAKEKGLSAIADVAMRRLFAPEFQKINPELTAARKQCFLAVDLQTFQSACEALSTLDIRDQLSKIKVPVLVLVGEHDEATPPPMSQELNAGLGLGAENVVGYSTLAEFAPPKYRGKLQGIMATFVVTGLPVSALLGVFLVPNFGWRIMFVIGGIGALIVWFIRKALPESPRWLESVGRDIEAEALMTKIESEVAAEKGTLPPLVYAEVKSVLLVIPIYVLVAGLFGMYVPELFPTEVRLRASGICNTFGRGATIGTPFLVVFLFNSFGVTGVLALMIALLIVQIIAVATIGIESSNLGLEELSAK